MVVFHTSFESSWHACSNNPGSTPWFQFEHEIFELVINCKDVELVFSRAEEKLIVEKIQETFSHFESGGLAIVAKTDLVFGLSRVLQSSIEKERIAVAVFRSEELARRWIEEVRYLHTQPHVAAEG